MFDVPVSDVTVSSIPAILIDSVGQTNNVESPNIFSLNLPNSLDGPPKPTRTTASLTKTKTLQLDSTPKAQTLLPQATFQLLEPLNLAYATAALEKAFTHSLGTIASVASQSSSRSSAVVTEADILLDSDITRYQQITLVFPELKPVTENRQKPVPILLHKQRNQCDMDAVLAKGLYPSEQQFQGTASWYGPYFHGRQTANGEVFDQNTLTAAHKSLPFNTVLQVRNLANDRSVVVRINDRGPYIGQRSLDLSKAAAKCLGSEKTGVIPYEAVVLKKSLEKTALTQ